MSDGRPTSKDARAERKVDTPGQGMPVLRYLPHFAALAVFCILLGRAIGPSVVGLAVGMGRLVSAVERAGRVASQFYAMVAIVFAMAEINAAMHARISPLLRIASIGLGGAAILVTLLSAPRRAFMPPLILTIMAIAVIALALVSAASAIRTTTTRAAAMVLGLVSAASLARLIAVGFAFQSKVAGFTKLGPVARSASTVGFVFDLCAVGVALAWIAARTTKKLTSPATLATLATSLVVTRLAMGADAEGASPTAVLLRRSLEHLLPLPLPYIPLAFQLFVIALATTTAIATLLAGRFGRASSGTALHPASGAVIALALIIRTSPDVPLGALTLVLAALGVALAARDDRAVWAAIHARSPEPQRKRED